MSFSSFGNSGYSGLKVCRSLCTSGTSNSETGDEQHGHTPCFTLWFEQKVLFLSRTTVCPTVKRVDKRRRPTPVYGTSLHTGRHTRWYIHLSSTREAYPGGIYPSLQPGKHTRVVYTQHSLPGRKEASMRLIASLFSQRCDTYGYTQGGIHTQGGIPGW